MAIQNTQLIEEFSSNRPLYERLEETVYHTIDQIIKEHRFFVMEVSHRVKSVDSLIGKIKRKSSKYHSLSDITDLVGIRIICYFSDTVDEIASIITRSFNIDYGNSVDKRASLSDTQFGYLSLHYVCSLPAQYGDLSGIPFEIQLRTVLQHTWAEIEHDLGYKNEFGVPRGIRREFSRVAGLLEVADELFISLRENTQKYTDDVRERITSGDADGIPIDRFSLSEFVKHNDDFCKFKNCILDTTGAEVEFIEPDTYLCQLEWLKIFNIGDLADVVRRNFDNVLSDILDQIQQLELEYISTNMILRNICRSEIISRAYSERELRDFVSIVFDDPDVIEKKVGKFMKAIEAKKNKN